MSTQVPLTPSTPSTPSTWANVVGRKKPAPEPKCNYRVFLGGGVNILIQLLLQALLPPILELSEIVDKTKKHRKYRKDLCAVGNPLVKAGVSGQTWLIGRHSNSLLLRYMQDEYSDHYDFIPNAMIHLGCNICYVTRTCERNEPMVISDLEMKYKGTVVLKIQRGYVSISDRIFDIPSIWNRIKHLSHWINHRRVSDDWFVYRNRISTGTHYWYYCMGNGCEEQECPNCDLDHVIDDRYRDRPDRQSLRRQKTQRKTGRKLVSGQFDKIET